jgi:hypothetical protein
MDAANCREKGITMPSTLGFGASSPNSAPLDFTVCSALCTGFFTGWSPFDVSVPRPLTIVQFKHDLINKSYLHRDIDTIPLASALKAYRVCPSSVFTVHEFKPNALIQNQDMDPESDSRLLAVIDGPWDDAVCSKLQRHTKYTISEQDGQSPVTDIEDLVNVSGVIFVDSTKCVGYGGDACTRCKETCSLVKEPDTFVVETTEKGSHLMPQFGENLLEAGLDILVDTLRQMPSATSELLTPGFINNRQSAPPQQAQQTQQAQQAQQTQSDSVPEWYPESPQYNPGSPLRDLDRVSESTPVEYNPESPLYESRRVDDYTPGGATQNIEERETNTKHDARSMSDSDWYPESPQYNPGSPLGCPQTPEYDPESPLYNSE